MGMGVVAGAALAMCCAPACNMKKPGKTGVGKFFRTIGSIMDEMVDSIGI